MATSEPPEPQPPLADDAIRERVKQMLTLLVGLSEDDALAILVSTLFTLAKVLGRSPSEVMNNVVRIARAQSH